MGAWGLGKPSYVGTLREYIGGSMLKTVLPVLLLWKLYFAQHAQAVEKYMLHLFDSLLKLEAINA